MKPCPACAALLDADAHDCRFCGTVFSRPALDVGPPTVTWEPDDGGEPRHRVVARRPVTFGTNVAANRPQLGRWSTPGLVVLTFATFGFGTLYVGWKQTVALRQLVPTALSPVVAVGVCGIGVFLTAGIAPLIVAFLQARSLVTYAEGVGDVRRNRGLVSTVMLVEGAAVVALWMGWTGIGLLAAWGLHLYSVVLVQRELELYTRE